MDVRTARNVGPDEWPATTEPVDEQNASNFTADGDDRVARLQEESQASVNADRRKDLGRVVLDAGDTCNPVNHK